MGEGEGTGGAGGGGGGIVGVEGLVGAVFAGGLVLFFLLAFWHGDGGDLWCVMMMMMTSLASLG